MILIDLHGWMLEFPSTTQSWACHPSPHFTGKKMEAVVKQGAHKNTTMKQQTGDLNIDCLVPEPVIINTEMSLD